jgi:hypothetical protein
MIIFNERSYKEKEKNKQTNDVELRIGSSRNRFKPTTERHCAIPKVTGEGGSEAGRSVPCPNDNAKSLRSRTLA